MHPRHATRSAPRHRLELALRFHHEQTSRSGVTENVSPTGMYVLASHAPSAGELLHFSLVDASHSGHIEFLTEVRWGRSAPSLDQPQPGFGVHFIEIVAADHEVGALIGLLEALKIRDARDLVHIETRDNTPVAVCRFA